MRVQLGIPLGFLLLLGLASIVLALGSDPQILFTDNTTATGTITTITAMEPQLINRLNAATTSI